MDFQTGNLAIDILTWVGIVLAAGFIGYFGRYLAMTIIERMRARKPYLTPPTDVAMKAPAGPITEAPAVPGTGPEVLQLQIEKERTKAEKKKAKAETKRLKKEQKK
jgi:hypothetical protein